MTSTGDWICLGGLCYLLSNSFEPFFVCVAAGTPPERPKAAAYSPMMMRVMMIRRFVDEWRLLRNRPCSLCSESVACIWLYVSVRRGSGVLPAVLLMNSCFRNWVAYRQKNPARSSKVMIRIMIMKMIQRVSISIYS